MDELEEIPMDYTFVFESFEDVIGLAKKLDEADLQTSLYFYEEKYYLHIIFDFEITEFDSVLNILSVVSEFANNSKTTIHIIQEYGKQIIESRVLDELNKHF